MSFNINLDDVCNCTKLPIFIYPNPLLKIANAIKNDEDIKFTKLSKDFKVTNTSKFYGLDVPELDGDLSSSRFFPWTHYEPITKYREVFFDIYSNKKYFKKEIRKTKSLFDSIKKNGYVPDLYPNRQGGHVTGYFLDLFGKKVFYVLSGNHRVAVLKALGKKKVDVIYRKYSHLKDRDIYGTNLKEVCPNVFFAKDVSNWPSVTSGYLTEKNALQIMEIYVNGKRE